MADTINTPTTNSAPPPAAPVAPLSYAPPARDGHAGVHDRRLATQPHAGDDGLDDGVDHEAAGYMPRPRHYEPRPETSIHGGVHDRVGQAVRVPLDDGIGRIKISIPSFSGKCERRLFGVGDGC